MGVAQRAVAAGGMAELHGQLAQKALPPEIAARARDLCLERLGQGEMLQQRDDVGEAFVEGKDVGFVASVYRRCKPSSRACVRLVGDDVCDKAPKTSTPGAFSDGLFSPH